MTDYPPIAGLILAGGLARRMGGGDKPMRTIGERTLLARVIDRLSRQCDPLLLNANGDPARFSGYRLPVVADTVEGHAGPLAGILAGLDWLAANRPGARWVLSAAGDCPFLPKDLVELLHRALVAQSAQVAVAASGGQIHHTIGLWSVALREDLRHALMVDDCRAVHRFTARFTMAAVNWPDTPIDPFFNANTPDDLDEAERFALIDDTAP